MKSIGPWIRSLRGGAVNAMGFSALVLTSLLVYGVVLRPAWSARKELAAKSQVSATQQRHLRTLQSAIQTLQMDVEQKRNLVFKQSLQVLAPAGLNTRLSNIASLCNGCGLTADEIQPGEPTTVSTFTMVPIHLTGRGNYGNCTSFIHHLHEEYGDATVYSFKLLASPQQVNAPCTFEFELHWLASPAAAPGSRPGVMTAELQ